MATVYQFKRWNIDTGDYDLSKSKWTVAGLSRIADAVMLPATGQSVLTAEVNLNGRYDQQFIESETTPQRIPRVRMLR